MAVTVDISRSYLASRLECVRAVMDGEVDGNKFVSAGSHYMVDFKLYSLN